jgi:TnpA family transposase
VCYTDTHGYTEVVMATAALLGFELAPRIKDIKGREFGDQIHTFSCLSVLHNAVVAWNTLHIGPIVGQLRAEGQVIDDHILGLTTPLFRKHVNPFGKYHFDLERMRQTEGGPEQGIA